MNSPKNLPKFWFAPTEFDENGEPIDNSPEEGENIEGAAEITVCRVDWVLGLERGYSYPNWFDVRDPEDEGVIQEL